jgi:hypothetical protein
MKGYVMYNIENYLKIKLSLMECNRTPSMSVVREMLQISMAISKLTLIKIKGGES